MGRRAAIVTQAEVARVIRAVEAAGLKVARVVARPDGIAVETANAVDNESKPVADKKAIVL